MGSFRPAVRPFFPSVFLFFFFGQTRGDGLGELIRPGITAVIVKRGFAKAHLGLFVDQIPAAATAFRQFIEAGKRHAENSSPKFLYINHTFLRLRPGAVAAGLSRRGKFFPLLPRSLIIMKR